MSVLKSRYTVLQLKRLEFQERDKERIKIERKGVGVAGTLKELKVRANKGTTMVPEVVTPSFDVSKHIRFSQTSVKQK